MKFLFNIKKVFKLALKLLTGLSAMLIVLLLVLWIFLNHSEQRIRRILDSAVDGKTEIGDISFSYPLKISITDFSVILREQSFSASELYADIDVFAFINKKIKVRKLVLKNPVFNQDTLAQNRKEDIAAKEDSLKRKNTPLFPFTLDLREIVLSSINLSFPLNKDSRINVNDLSLIIRDLKFKQNDSTGYASGKILLSTEHGILFYKNAEKEYTFDLAAKLDLSVQDYTNWETDSFIRLIPQTGYAGLKLYVKAGSAGRDTINLENISLLAGKKKLVGVKGYIKTPVNRSSRFDFSVTGSAVKSETIIKLLEPFIAVLPVSVSGVILPVRGRIFGTVSEPGGYLSWGVKNVKIKTDSLYISNTEFSVRADLKNIIDKSVEGIADFYLGTTKISVKDTLIFSFEKASFQARSIADSSFSLFTTELTGSVDSVFSGDITVKGKLSNNLQNNHYSASLTINADSLSLNKITPETGLQGKTSLTIHADFNSSGKTDASVSVSTEKIYLLSENNLITSPPLHAFLYVSAQQNKGDSWTVHKSSLNINDIVSTDFSGRLSGSGNSEIYIRNGTISLEEVNRFRQSVKGIPLLPANVKGETKFSGKINFNKDKLTGKGSVNITVKDINLPADSLSAKGLNCSLDISAVNDSVFYKGKIVLDSLYVSRMSALPFTGSEIKFNGQISESSKIDFENMSLSFDRDLLNAGIYGFTCKDSSFISGDILFNGPMHRRSLSGFTAKGSAQINFNVRKTENTVLINGGGSADSLFFNAGNIFRLYNINMNIPFDLSLSQEGSLLSASKKEDTGFQDYLIHRSVYKNTNPEIGSIKADSIVVSNMNVSSLDVDVIVNKGEIRVPFFGALMLGGSIAGSFGFKTEKMNLKDIEYNLSGQFSGIDANYISKLQGTENTKVNATTLITGRGLDPEKGLDINGYFYISDMGKDVASAILRSIDPSGTDKSIQITDKLIRTGWKPLLFSFDLKHGYIYPSLKLSQPWFSPVRIPDKLEYGRIPIAFFMKNVKKNKED